MFNKIVIAVIGVIVSVAAIAQAQFGTITNVQGLVTVSDGTTIGNAVVGGSVGDGSRFVTGSSGSVTFWTKGGCEVTLSANQTLTVNERVSCDVLLAGIQTINPETAGGFFAGNDVIGNGLLIAAGLIIMNQVISTQ